MKSKGKTIGTVIILSFLTLAIFSSLAAQTVFAKRETAKIAQEIRKTEMEIAKLRRSNEELSVKIAEQENPTWLGRRAANRFARTDAKLVVWAFENFKGGRIEFSPDNQKILSFKMPLKGAKQSVK